MHVSTGPDQARSSFLAFLLSEARRLLVAQGLGPDKVAAGLTGLGTCHVHDAQGGCSVAEQDRGMPEVATDASPALAFGGGPA